MLWLLPSRFYGSEKENLFQIMSLPNSAPPLSTRSDKLDSQLPPCEDYLYCDPNYPVEAYAL
jgi:hypothetical protein